MKAVVWHGVGEIQLDDVPVPTIEARTDAIVNLTASAICGTDLHFVRGTMSGMQRGTILGHEGVGTVMKMGMDVRNLNLGDRVVVMSTIACGYCAYCLAGFYSKCDHANPNGKDKGTAFFGGPKTTGPFDGLQAEQARIPFAGTTLVKLPDSVDDKQAILISDIFPTGYFGADMAGIKPGRSVAVFGCGPVGQFAIASARLMNAGRVFAIDAIPSRLDMARAQGAEVISFNEEDPVQTLQRLTGQVGPESVIEAVGVDAYAPTAGPAARPSSQEEEEEGGGGEEEEEEEEEKRTFRNEVKVVAPQQNPEGDNWHPGDAPSQVLQWAVESVAKAGTISIIGVYPPQMKVFPIGKAMSKNLTLRMGDCPHRRYGPKLVDMVATGVFDPTTLLTQTESLDSAIEAYKAFDKREQGWIKVELLPSTDGYEDGDR